MGSTSVYYKLGHTETIMNKEKNLEGLDGWLILVGLEIIIMPILIIAGFLSIYSEMFSDWVWYANYNRAPILIGHIAVYVGLLLTSLFIAFLFFSKKKVFPKWYIGFWVFISLFMLVQSLAEFANILKFKLPWILYMLMSKRVKATFVK